jgi:DNA-binding response OmpR family regulator
MNRRQGTSDREPLAAIGVDLDEFGMNGRQRVLVVEDEMDTVFLLKQILRLEGFNVLSAISGREALAKLADHQPDLVLLDLMMPEMDGWEMLRNMRKMVSDLPVIIISALGSQVDVVKGLQAGADDYIAKPFYNAEVTERVKAVLRRTSKPQELSKLVFAHIGLELDLESQEVSVHGEAMQLTPKEFAVLLLLAKHAPAIVNYETIADEVWGEDSVEIRRRIKYLVYLLRRKIKQLDPDLNIILNVDRLGYKLQIESLQSEA